MDRAAGPVALQLRKLECFGDDSLARERRIAVNEDRQNGTNDRVLDVNAECKQLELTFVGACRSTLRES